MFRSRSADQTEREESQIYDAILMQLCNLHPRLTVTEEANLKGRLLRVIDTCLGQHDPRRFVRLFQDAMLAA